MTTKKYYYDPSAESLTVVEFDEAGEISGITELSEPFVLEPITPTLEDETEEQTPLETDGPKRSDGSTAKSDWRRKPQRPRKCSSCGEEGHNAKTCPIGGRVKVGKPVDPRFEHDSERSTKFPIVKPLRQQVADQRADGVTMEEMYDLFPDHEMAEISAVYRSIEESEDEEDRA